MKNGLTLALPKGRLLDPALDLLRELGVSGIDPDSRKLIFRDAGRDLEVLLLKPADVPAYVIYGAADLGVVGKDILLEQEPDVYEPLDLGFGFCRLVVAEPRALWERDDPAKWSWVRVPPSIRASPRNTSRRAASRWRSYGSTAPSSWRRWSASPSGSWTSCSRARRCARTGWWRSPRSRAPPRG